jgi:hypothetical protein
MAIALLASSATVLVLGTRVDITSQGRPELLALDAKNNVKPPDCSEFSIGVAQRTMATTARDLLDVDSSATTYTGRGPYKEAVVQRRQEARATLFMCNVATDPCIYEREHLEYVIRDYMPDHSDISDARDALAACEAGR